MRKQKALKNIVSSLILQLVVVVYGFVVPKIIITNFGSEINGLVSSITQFLSYITLLESGFGPVIKSVLYKPIAKNDKKMIASILKSSEAFFKKIACLFILYVLLLSIIYPIIVPTSIEPLLTALLIVIISVGIFAEYFFGITYKIFLDSKQCGYVVSCIQIVSYIICTLLVIIAAKAGASIYVIKLITSIVFVLRPIIQNYYVKKKYNIILEESTEKYIIKQKWDGMSQHVASVIHSHTDVIVLSLLSTLDNVSIYSVYAIVTKGLKSLIQPFTNSFESLFGDMIAKNEKENMLSKFNVYETIYNLLITICFTSAIVLITPFVNVYTAGITDADYNQLVFGVLLVLGEYVWAIRQPYNNLIKAAGHFKETMVGAWVECLTNIIVSVILVFNYGLIGVAIGTLVAMTIRTVEFIYHTNKYILGRSITDSIKKIFTLILETLLAVGACSLFPYLEYTNYFNWIINAVITMIIITAISLVITLLLYRNEIKNAHSMIKLVLPWRRKKNYKNIDEEDDD